MISARSALSGHVGRSRVLGFGAYRALAPLREVRPVCIKGQRGPAGGGLEDKIRIVRWTSSVCEFVPIPVWIRLLYPIAMEDSRKKNLVN